ncbi:hypothetical protein D0Z00_003068 [Geotrichum galactomycetum]|uniref:Uncharacterized protein n=1 Tax=Geotrichum galactomycetum TaxID=27317 RepID=A0ACB6V2K1_9ASCO|nr:hypothetical protein D0Z00_003068 [Geotrichum candidum]
MILTALLELLKLKSKRRNAIVVFFITDFVLSFHFFRLDFYEISEISCLRTIHNHAKLLYPFVNKVKCFPAFLFSVSFITMISQMLLDLQLGGFDIVFNVFIKLPHLLSIGFLVK